MKVFQKKCLQVLDVWYNGYMIKERNEGNEMTYSDAIELLGLTTPKSMKENARLAESKLQHITAKAPLRYKVAARIVIRAAK